MPPQSVASLQTSRSISLSRSYDSPGQSLRPALVSLSAGIQDIMSSLHNVQTATMNANGGLCNPRFHDAFTQLRQSLHREWEYLTRFLRQCYEFSHRATLLCESQRELADDEFIHYSMDLVTFTGTLLSGSQAILAEHQRITAQVARWAPHLTSFLRHAGKSRRIHVYQTVPEITARSEARDTMRDFVQSSLQTAYPDGLTALASTAEALNSISVCLSMISQVCAAVYDEHHQFADDPQSQFLVVDARETRWREQPLFMLDGWKEDAELILAVIGDLEKMSDAITIDPVAPRPYKRGRKSSPNLGHTSRPSSGLDEVATCWDMIFVHCRRR
ncbi:hypothetical protein DXG03_005812 [Asterophora parasitica]|uniref:Uncharacterized protein n=1 Tax=Asterophora parasitica TaxID=117018 RepID=A0A9P7GEI1_9AGAR|nr:hypothetical protein DXG03_005812 [Asterophora parasitica]